MDATTRTVWGKERRMSWGQAVFEDGRRIIIKVKYITALTETEEGTDVHLLNGEVLSLATPITEVENTIFNCNVEVVLCKDCKHHEDEENGMVYCKRVIGGWADEEWFCADGERKES